MVWHSRRRKILWDRGLASDHRERKEGVCFAFVLCSCRNLCIGGVATPAAAGKSAHYSTSSSVFRGLGIGMPCT